MKSVMCRNCGDRVVPHSDETCPSCRSSLAISSASVPNVSALNPYVSPIVVDSSTELDSAGMTTMTTWEKIYSAIVILCAGFPLVTLAIFYFVILSGEEDPGIFYFMVSILWLIFLSLAVTVATNLFYRRLLVIPTIIQGAVLCLMVYFIPFGILGFVLLRERTKRESQRQAALQTPGVIEPEGD